MALINTQWAYSYILQRETVSHKFISLNFYICTLPFESFESIEATTMDTGDGVAAVPHASKLTSAKAFSMKLFQKLRYCINCQLVTLP